MSLVEVVESLAARSSVDEERVRTVLARAVALGALGAAVVVRRHGQDVLLSGHRVGRLSVAAGRFQGVLEVPHVRRLGQGALSAATTACATALLFGWPFWWALPTGMVVGAALTIAGLRDDRASARAALRALVANLELLLLDERGEQSPQAHLVEPQP